MAHCSMYLARDEEYPETWPLMFRLWSPWNLRKEWIIGRIGMAECLPLCGITPVHQAMPLVPSSISEDLNTRRFSLLSSCQRVKYYRQDQKLIPIDLESIFFNVDSIWWIYLLKQYCLDNKTMLWTVLYIHIVLVLKFHKLSLVHWDVTSIWELTTAIVYIGVRKHKRPFIHVLVALASMDLFNYLYIFGFLFSVPLSLHWIPSFGLLNIWN